MRDLHVYEIGRRRKLYVGRAFADRPLLVALKGFGQYVSDETEHEDKYLNFASMSGLFESAEDRVVTCAMPSSGMDWGRRDDGWLAAMIDELVEAFACSTVWLAGFSDGAARVRQLAWAMPSVEKVVVWSGMFSVPSRKPRDLPTLLVHTNGEGVTARGTKRARRYYEQAGLSFDWLEAFPTGGGLAHRWVPEANPEIFDWLFS